MPVFWVISLLGIVGTLVAIAVHYVYFGPRHPRLPKERFVVRRMSLLERLIHALLVLGFLGLSTTGFIAVLALKQPLTGWLRMAHMSAAPLFLLAAVAACVRWADQCRWQAYDWEWAKRCGGYLWDKREAPAGRFNAGQKGFFWATVGLGLLVGLSGLGRAFHPFPEPIQALLYEAHRYASLAFLLSVISHIYLATVANPGTLRVMLSGRVTPSWAQNHHPLWWQELSEKARSESPSQAERPE